MKILFVLAAACLIGCASTAIADIRSKDYPCDGDGSTELWPYGVNISRHVDFFDGSGTFYYCYYVLCDGSIIERWLGDVQPIGYVPAWAFPFTMTQVVETSSGVEMQIYSAGYLAASITFDQVPGHHATVTVYPNPFQ